MPGGPIIVFDKSALQSFSLDEAVLFDNFYTPVITPLFFMETLADLEKKVREGQTPEQVVGIIAEKTPEMSGIPTMHHLTLIRHELLGHAVSMNQRPIVGQVRRVTTGDQRGVIIEQLPEMEAFERWQERSFFEVERQYARQWRAELARWDPNRGKEFSEIVGKEARVKNLPEAKEVADRLISGNSGQRYAVLKAVFEMFEAPPPAQREIIGRWKLRGGPPLPEFVPYTSHVVRIEFFLQLALQLGLISSKRASNKVDMAYLFYLPFCMAFLSDDGLHMRTVPLFLNDQQMFISGDELKADLANLNRHYSVLAPEVLDQGIYRFAPYPPIDDAFFTTRLWDKFMHPDWRKHMTRSPKPSPESEAKLRVRLQQMDSAQDVPPDEIFDSDSVNFLTINRKVPTEKGKLIIIPRDHTPT